ncbi:MAG: type I-C CRISPR-associated protein Cas7/Csd2 [Micavibrio sp.]|nr:MAG: type I-C CRISPR-associated protein Cas7/Csd2 [Micavibrio sp.]
MSSTINRAEFVLIFDVKDGNPNGDPDAGNLPRVDTETGHGLVTDVCLKRKIRNYVGIVKGEQPPYEIYVKEKAVLNKTHERAYEAIGVDISGDEKKRKGGGDNVGKARDWMCKNFFDVRTFGAVMSTGVNCGQVRGPVQLTFARSVDPIVPLEHSITRMAVATEKEAEKQDGDNRTMGRKHTISYGLYVARGFISGHLAEQTGFSEEDFDLLVESLTNMFDHDRSAARGEMATRGLYIFRHNSPLGKAPAHELLDRVKITRKNSVDVPRSFADYTVTVDEGNIPDGVELLKIVDIKPAKAAA